MYLFLVELFLIMSLLFVRKLSALAYTSNSSSGVDALENVLLENVSKARRLVDSPSLNRLKFLNETSTSAVLVHTHIQKAAGTAIADSLSTSCDCKVMRRKGVLGKRFPVTHCTSCPKVSSRDARGKEVMSFTVNRNLGWLCGTHMPLVSMFECMAKRTGQVGEIDSDGGAESGGGKLVDKIVPIHIVMIREPWSRFQSEVAHMSRSEPQNVGIKDVAAPKMRSGDASTGNLLKHLVELPASYIIHNREVKMVGGRKKDFNFNYNNLGHPGSRWTGAVDDGSMRLLLARAQHRLGRRDVVLLLSEHFSESLCLLEAIYGAQYRFDWDPNTNSHSHARPRNATSSVGLLPSIRNSTRTLWEQKNRWDLQFYRIAEEMFRNDMIEVKRWLVDEIARGATSRSAVPHCGGVLA